MSVKVAPFAPTTQQTSGPHDLTDDDRKRHYEFKLSITAGAVDGADPEQAKNEDGTPILPIDDVNKLGDDDLIFRHLIAKKWDFAIARQSLREYAAFRREMKVNTIFADWAFESPLIRSQMCGYFGHDREGYPVYYDRPQPSEINKLLAAEPREALIAWHVMVAERGRFLAKKAGMDRMTVVTDLRHVGMSIIGSPSAMKLMKEFSHIDQHRYPENMRVLCIINAPMTFKAIWAAVKPLLEERVQKKMRVCSRLNQMFEVIPEAAVPTEFGGKATGFKKLGDEYDTVRAEMIAAQREPTPPQPTLNRIASVPEKVRVRRSSVGPKHAHAPSTSSGETAVAGAPRSLPSTAAKVSSEDDDGSHDDDEEPVPMDVPAIASGSTKDDAANTSDSSKGTAASPASDGGGNPLTSPPTLSVAAGGGDDDNNDDDDDEEITEYDPYEVGTSPPSTSTAASPRPWASASPLPGESVPGSPRNTGSPSNANKGATGSPLLAGSVRRNSLDVSIAPRAVSSDDATPSTTASLSAVQSRRLSNAADRPAAPVDDTNAASPRHGQIVPPAQQAAPSTQRSNQPPPQEERSPRAPPAAVAAAASVSPSELQGSFSAPASIGASPPTNSSPIEILQRASQSPAMTIVQPASQQHAAPMQRTHPALKPGGVAGNTSLESLMSPKNVAGPMTRSSTGVYRDPAGGVDTTTPLHSGDFSQNDIVMHTTAAALPAAMQGSPAIPMVMRAANPAPGTTTAYSPPLAPLSVRQLAREFAPPSPRAALVQLEEADEAQAPLPLLHAPSYDAQSPPWAAAVSRGVAPPDMAIGFVLLPSDPASPDVAAARSPELSPARHRLRQQQHRAASQSASPAGSPRPVAASPSPTATPRVRPEYRHGIPDPCSPARGRNVFATAFTHFEWTDAALIVDSEWETLVVRDWPSRRHLATLALDAVASMYPVDTAAGRAQWGLPADVAAAPFVVAVEADPKTVARSSTADAGPAVFGRDRNPTVLVAFATRRERDDFLTAVATVYGSVVSHSGRPADPQRPIPASSVVALPVSLDLAPPDAVA